MYIINIDRLLLVTLIPAGGKGAEVGVAAGHFSEHLYRATNPSELILIDPWEHQKRDDYLEDVNNVAEDEAFDRYKRVQSVFSHQIESSRVKVMRQYSEQALSSLPDNYLDWIYIDGLHTYDGVRKDLEIAFKKVKSGGLILGHDFTNRPGALKMNFGVIPALCDFASKSDCDFLFLTNDENPTYFLMKEHYKHWEKYCEIEKNVLLKSTVACEITTEMARKLQHREKILRDSDGSVTIRTYFSYVG